MIMEAHELERYEGRQIQRYRIFGAIAAGGMATVHLARLTGPAGFSRIVAMKHLHPHFSADPEFRVMLIDEAWLAARVRHPNVVPILDVLAEDGDIFIVMEYVHGEPLSVLRRAAEKLALTPSLPVCSAIMVAALQGLHAAHDARTETGLMLQIVHRDVSPQNIIVSADGVPMVIDFGVAKAIQAHEETKPGVIKGKSGYMAPEQIRGEEVTRAADIFAAAIVLWELLTSRRLFGGGTELERMNRALLGTGVVPPSQIVSGIPAELDAVVMKGLCPEPKQRFESALEMADALERAIPPASQRTLAAWVRLISAGSLARRAELLNEIELSAVTARAPEVIELEAPTVVSPDLAGGSDQRLLSAGPLQVRPAGSVWSDRRTLIVAGLAALLLVLLLASTFGRRRRPRNLAMADSSAKVFSRPGPVIVVQPSVPDLSPPKPEVDSRAPLEGAPALPASYGSPFGDREYERPRRWSFSTTRRSPRDRTGRLQGAGSGLGTRAEARSPTAPTPHVEIANTAPPSSPAPPTDRPQSEPVTGDAQTRVPLVADPPHTPLLE
jgi:serine/threonine-protein kinase